jgi:hypothetical protein
MSTATFHDIAKERFRLNPAKCYQRHIRDVHAEIEPREQIDSLQDAEVISTSKTEASKIILRYEWLRTLGRGASSFYGLSLDGELIGAVCFGVGASPEARNICGAKYIQLAACLMRGACVPWAPKNAASFLIRHACRQAYKDHGWQIFFAYSDPAAGEIGTVYQAANWFYIGQGLGRRKGDVHLDWIAPNGTIVSSHHKKLRTKKDMFALGYRPMPAIPKRKYVWFEGSPTERQRMRSQCRFPRLTYPKKSDHCGSEIKTAI